MKIDISLLDAESEYLVNQFVDKFGGSPYLKTHWVKSIISAYGHDFFYLIAKSGNKIVGVFPLCKFKDISNKLSLCSLPYCDIGGILSINDEVKESLLGYAIELLNEKNLRKLEIRSRNYASEIDVEEKKTQKVSMLLELPKNSDELFTGFKSKLRSQIRKSEKNGLTFDASNSKDSIDDFFYVFSRNMHDLGSPTHSIKWFREISKLFKEDMLVGRVWLGSQIIGSGILLFSGKNVSIPWASTLRSYNHLAPNMLLYWNLLKVSCDRKCNLFDFGRSSFGEGTYKFKQQWGARPVLLDWYTLDNQGRYIDQDISGPGSARQFVESIWKKMPLSLVNAIGPRVRGYISL